ncbi:MAG: twin-arginine translocase TatA/TatE family subunit [Alphaproteobacteria bacterium]|jgi:Sec-independent protein translocase protein TatA|nr:twin-arginine translocase TatA/TatE family subunit [Alphaproteobacteria bacterium]
MLPEVGFTEILVVAVVALLVLKPSDLPAFMRQLGLWSATARRNLQGMYEGWLEQAEQAAKGPKDGPQ